MRVPHGSTILIADGRKRLFARNDGDADRIVLSVVGAAEEAGRPTHEIATDAAGRSPGGAGGVGGSSVETADPHDHEEQLFAKQTAEMLNKGVADGSFKQLVVIAAPRTLGVMRKHYGRAVTGAILGELPKDLTGTPIDAVARLLAEH